MKLEIQYVISSGLLELYAAGLTMEQESREIEWLLQRSPEVADELISIAESIEVYAQHLAIVPAKIIKKRIFDAINRKSNSQVVAIRNKIASTEVAKYNITSFWKIIAAASVIFLFASLISNFLVYNKYAKAHKQLEIVQQRLKGLKTSNTELEAGINVIRNKYSVPVALNGLKASPDAAAKVFWIKNTGEVYIDASNLPEVPLGKQYQLWGIVNGNPVDGGMILKTSKGQAYHLQKMKAFGKAEAFAITLEPEKGNPTPQGPMYVMGKM